MQFSPCKNLLVLLTMTAVFTAAAFFLLKDEKQLRVVGRAQIEKLAPALNISQDVSIKSQISKPVEPPASLMPKKLSNPPEIIKAVYMTGYSAGTKSYLAKYLTNFLKDTEINAVVVDIKGSDGRVSYASGATEVEKYSLSNNMISDIDALVEFFHERSIYVIGRIAVFEDPVYAKARPDLAIYNKKKSTKPAEGLPVVHLWKDNNGLEWLDPSAKDVWDYNISLARDAFYHGFDEVNFDYIRFATDGNISNMGYPFYDGKTPKATVINNFFSYLRQQLENEKISADLFGLTTVNDDDLGIGQVIENAMENFDYISPMVYPSHYANGFIGFNNPAEHPYEVIKYSLENAAQKTTAYVRAQKDRIFKMSEATASPAATLQSLMPLPKLKPLAKIRPWIQDFNMGAQYDSQKVKEQIQATQDALAKEYSGYMLWNPSNIYTKQAVLNLKTEN